MRKLTRIEGYIGRLTRAVEYLKPHIAQTTVDYAHDFLANLPTDFDNSHRWKRMEFGRYNYRHGVHNSFAGILGEIYSEAAWTRDGGQVTQLFDDKEMQVQHSCDQIVLYNGAKLFNQCKSARISKHAAKGDSLVVWQRMFNIPTYLNCCITLCDLDKKKTVAVSSKVFVDALPQCTRYGDEIWMPITILDKHASVHTFQQTL